MILAKIFRKLPISFLTKPVSRSINIFETHIWKEMKNAPQPKLLEILSKSENSFENLTAIGYLRYTFRENFESFFDLWKNSLSFGKTKEQFISYLKISPITVLTLFVEFYEKEITQNEKALILAHIKEIMSGKALSLNDLDNLMKTIYHLERTGKLSNRNPNSLTFVEFDVLELEDFYKKNVEKMTIANKLIFLDCYRAFQLSRHQFVKQLIDDILTNPGLLFSQTYLQLLFIILSEKINPRKITGLADGFKNQLDLYLTKINQISFLQEKFIYIDFEYFLKVLTLMDILSVNEQNPAIKKILYYLFGEILRQGYKNFPRILEASSLLVTTQCGFSPEQVDFFVENIKNHIKKTNDLKFNIVSAIFLTQLVNFEM